ncbi:YybH family protein [Pseudonocardia hispaniensis]|uniref:YybH family protein n=1 Tax=Pseudonocardia hispaniensis TaxID=904933 RepID=A0ABW1J192_9PSEU
MGDATLQQAIDQAADGARAFLNGDPAEFTQLVTDRLAWASARFRRGELRYEPIASSHSGDLAYAIGIERGRATVVDQDEPGELTLRVTHLFRRENGQWRLVHRHADAVTTVLPPTGLLTPTTVRDGSR